MADDTQVKEDIETLETIAKSFEDEAAELQDLVVKMKEKFEKETADDMAAIDTASKELDDLEKQADDDEQQGGVANAQQNVQNF